MELTQRRMRSAGYFAASTITFCGCIGNGFRICPMHLDTAHSLSLPSSSMPGCHKLAADVSPEVFTVRACWHGSDLAHLG